MNTIEGIFSAADYDIGHNKIVNLKGREKKYGRKKRH